MTVVSVYIVMADALLYPAYAIAPRSGGSRRCSTSTTAG
jgi:hypothetical protein